MTTTDLAKQHYNAAVRALRVAEENLKFAKLSAKQKRVAIAKDAIAALNTKRFLAEAGTYIDDATAPKGCNVCALGAVFVCAMDRGMADRAPTNGWGDADADKMRANLSPYFTEEQLRLIESAFEIEDFSADGDDDATLQAIAFGKRYKTDAGRLRAIMQNIIDNDGTFKPGKK